VRRRCHRIVLGLTALLSATGCAGAAPTGSTAPSGGDHGAPTPTALVVTGELSDAAAPLGEGRDWLRPLVATAEPAAWEPPSAAVDTAWQQYVGLEFDSAVETIRAAVIDLESNARTPEHFDALGEAMLIRGMCELALRRDEAGRESLRAAAGLRPERVLEEGRYPPPVREAYERERAAVRAEPASSITVTVEPAGARLTLDGEEGGAAPATLHSTSGRHHLRVEAPGYASRTLTVTLRPEGVDPLSVALPPAETPEMARMVVALDDDPGELTRHAIGRTLRSRHLIRARVAQGGGVDAMWLDLESGEARHLAAANLEEAVDALAVSGGSGDAPPEPGWHANDGFFMRLSAGPTLRGDNFEQSDPSLSGSGASFAGDLELAIGGSLGRGWVLGGTLGFQIGNADIETDETAMGTATLESVGTLAAFIAWYPGGMGGFHALFSVGPARSRLKADGGDIAQRDNMVGATAVLGFGHEWWVASDWAVGGMLRFIAFSLQSEGTKAGAGGLSLVGTVTWN